MKCERSTELDLAAFLAGESSEQIDAFRAHYPGCPDCSVEVRAWMELHAELGPQSGAVQHPSDELLLQFESQAEKMSAVARSSVETHLSSCASCRDELRTLRTFDFSLLQGNVEEARSVAQEKSPAWWSRIFAPVRTVLLHPAFAYGLVVVLLLPQLARLQPGLRPQGIAPTADRRVESKLPAAAPPPPAAHVAGPQKQSADHLAQAELAEKKQPQPAEEAPVAAVRGGKEVADGRGLIGRDAAQGLAAAGAANGSAEKREMTSLTAQKSAKGVERSQTKDKAAPKQESLTTPAFRDANPSHELPPDTTKLIKIEMDPSGRNNLPVHGVLGGATMRLEPRQPFVVGGDVAVRVKSADGRRELREIHTAKNSAYLDIAIPPGWMPDGSYSVEVWALDQLPKAPLPHRHEAFR